MAVIDDKVVAMSFESSKFESGVNKAITSLDNLKKALTNTGAMGQSLHGVATASKAVDLGHIAKGAESIKAKLGALNVAAVAIFANIASKAVAAGAQIVKALTIDPIKTGFTEYATNLNAVQTILANTQAAGVKLPQVNAALKELNEYSDKTIYNFSQMARNIGTFTAAGVELKTATGAIKGIANLAALSGSNAEQAATAMYQLSQAISAGSVKLMDWNSVVNAGMGGTVFQRALAQTAAKVGTLDEKAIKLTGSMKNVSINGEAFRQSLSTPGKASWLTSEVLTTTLKQFTGDLKDADLAAQGFTKSEIKSIQQTAQTAMKAATEVKTIQQAFEVAKETAGSGWAQTFQIVFGTFTEAKKTFTEFSETINGFINRNADARNKVLADWKKLGGRTELINGIKSAFDNLLRVIYPIQKAFRDIFPAATGKSLYDLTVRFSKFMDRIKPSADTIENLARTFKGIFAVLDIGKMIVVGIFNVLRQLFGAIGSGSGGFLEFTARIGDWLVGVRNALKEGEGIAKFFEGLGDILVKPIELLGKLASAISEIFSGGFSSEMTRMTGAVSPFERALEGISYILGKFLDLLGEVGEIVEPLVELWVDSMRQLGPALAEAFRNMNFEAVLAIIRTGLFAGIFLMFKKFFGGGPFVEQLTRGFAGIGGGVVGNLNRSFGALTGALGALQANIKAKTLKEIAIAVALLAGSMVALSFVDPKKLNSALSAITIAFGQLLGSMFVLGTISKSLGFIKMPVIATTLIMLAAAIDVLAISVIAFSFIKLENLAKGLGGVAASLGIMIAASGPLAKMSPRLVIAGAGITAIATGLNIMAVAVRQLGSMGLQQLAKGLGSVAVSLGILVKAMAVMPYKGMLRASAAIIVISVALNILALAVRQFGSMDLKTLGLGLFSIGAALAVIGLAMKIMPKGMILQSVGLVAIGVALNLIAQAVKSMGGMSMEQMSRGLIALALSLAILAGALHIMQGAIVGAIALTLAAAGITVLVGALKTLGEMSWDKIIKGLIALAAVIAVIVGAAMLLGLAAAPTLAFSIALLALGAAVALVGAGIFLIGVGLAALITAVSVSVGVILKAITELQKGIVENAKLVALGALEIVEAFSAIAPKFVDAIVDILESVLDAIIKLSPKLIDVVDALIIVLVKVLDHNQDKIIKAGLDLIIALLKGIRDNIREVVKLVLEIIDEFLMGIAQNIRQIITAGTKVLVAFLKGISDNYRLIIVTVLNIISNFLSAIANNLWKIIAAGASIITKFLGAIAAGLRDVIKAGTDVIVAYVTGIGRAGERIVTAAREAAGKFIKTLAKEIVKLADDVFVAMIALINGLAKVIDERAPEMRKAGGRLGKAIVMGMIGGLTAMLPDLKDAVVGMAGKAIGWFGDKIKGRSPSLVFKEFGKSIVDGLTNGLSEDEKAMKATEDLGNGVITAMKDIFKIASPSQVMREIGQEVGRGFAEGLTGSEDDINNAFLSLNDKLTDSIIGLKSAIASERENLAELWDVKKKDRDYAAIKQAQKSIEKNQALLERITAGRTELVKNLKDERAELILTTQKHDEYNKNLEKEQGILDDLIQTRKDARTSYQEQYSDLPDVTAEDEEGLPVADPVGVYKAALTTQIEAVKVYASTLQQLRELGLDDETYKKLLAEGPQAQAFATKLLEGGATAVQSVSTLSNELELEADKLGTTASANLYDAGVKAQEGIVAGLVSDIAGIEKQMEKIAKAMIRGIKKALKIKSPSEVFAEIGKFAMEGMAQGFSDSSKLVTDAADQAAQDALTAMQKSMRDISTAVTDELNPNPVITPILDLTQIQSKAAELARLTNVVPISAAASFGQASAISAEQAALQSQFEQDVIAARGSMVKFEQNNYSPEALSEVEIYRQTKNQISQLKSALSLT